MSSGSASLVVSTFCILASLNPGNELERREHTVYWFYQISAVVQFVHAPSARPKVCLHLLKLGEVYYSLQAFFS